MFKYWIETQQGNKKEITHTFYDQSEFDIPNFLPQNLRNRISNITYDYNGDVIKDNSMHYSYDVHGNVATIINSYNNTPVNENKR